jgi:hypothetical protein
MVIKRFSNILGSRKGTNPFKGFGGGSSSEPRPDGGSAQDEVLEEGSDTPEGNVARGVRLFCESAGSGVRYYYYC